MAKAAMPLPSVRASPTLRGCRDAPYRAEGRWTLPRTGLGKLAWKLTHKPKLTILVVVFIAAAFAALHFAEVGLFKAYERCPAPDDVRALSIAMDPWDDDPELQEVARPKLYEDLRECLDMCRATKAVPGEAMLAILVVETTKGTEVRMTFYVDGMLTVGSNNYGDLNVSMARAILSAM